MHEYFLISQNDRDGAHLDVTECKAATSGVRYGFLVEAQNPLSNHSCPAIRSICLALQARLDAAPIGARLDVFLLIQKISNLKITTTTHKESL
jgi:hypothetical protein